MRGRCHFCKSPVDPYVIVDTMYEFKLVNTWAYLTDVDVTANDAIYKILSPNRTVRTCRDCFFPPKFSSKDLLARETGQRVRFKVPPRKTWNSQEIYDWYTQMKTCPLTYEQTFDLGIGLVNPGKGFYIRLDRDFQ